MRLAYSAFADGRWTRLITNGFQPPVFIRSDFQIEIKRNESIINKWNVSFWLSPEKTRMASSPIRRNSISVIAKSLRWLGHDFQVIICQIFNETQKDERFLLWCQHVNRRWVQTSFLTNSSEENDHIVKAKINDWYWFPVVSIQRSVSFPGNSASPY